MNSIIKVAVIDRFHCMMIERKTLSDGHDGQNQDVLKDKFQRYRTKKSIKDKWLRVKAKL